MRHSPRPPRRSRQHSARPTTAYLQTTEVTNGQFRRFKSDHDSGTPKGKSLNGDSQPVTRVSWNDARDCLAWLSREDSGRRYRLPTEAEWEYGARAGTQTRYSFSARRSHLVRYVNFADKNTDFSWRETDLDDGHGVSAPVGSYLPNSWGLFDMAGNVQEWVQDRFGPHGARAMEDPMGPSSGEQRVIRGGAWESPASQVRVASRLGTQPFRRGDTLGFRAVVPVGAGREQNAGRSTAPNEKRNFAAELAKWLAPASEGDVAAMHRVALLYFVGAGGSRDIAEALRWYRKAADMDSVVGMFGIGLLYRDGAGVEQDFGEAMRWFRKAADLGIAAATYEVGRLHMHGQGVTQDNVEALRWFRKAVELGHAEAQALVKKLSR